VGAPVVCDDGVSCTVDACDEPTDSCAATPNDAACSDGLHCNGAETCDALLGCQTAAAVVCDDGVACTVDACDEGADACVASPNHGACDDGLYCNGGETCDALLGCQAGTPVVCDDGVACTTDACNEATDSCSATPSAAACDDGLYCTGAETCDALLGCQAGTPVACAGDGVACTVDACDEALDACASSPDHAACGDGVYCNGAETCDALLGCQAGAPVVCDDGIACTLDSCDEGTDSCAAAPDDAACGDGLFCNGFENCDTVLGCQAGTAVACSDGVACTVEWCDEATDSCHSTPNSAACDDGLYCTGAETCTPIGCLSGTPVVCNDGVACTVDACDEATDACSVTPNDAACSDGLFCTGAETCDVLLGCQAAAAPNCDDGQVCTTDSCNEAADVCDHEAVPDGDVDGHCDVADNCPLNPNPTQADADGDAVGDTCDNCDLVDNGPAEAAVPFIGNQSDVDSDGVGDACDNCVNVSNAPVAPLGFQTVTGGQLDDDADGWGNACDADFNQAGNAVESSDLTMFKTAFGQKRTTSLCNPGGTSPCDVYDLTGVGGTIDSSDLTRFKQLFGKTKKQDGDLMDRCPQCGPPYPDANLPCSGDACP
jgi:hypothetical protein